MPGPLFSGGGGIPAPKLRIANDQPPSKIAICAIVELSCWNSSS